jgi:hypothetical protein
MGSPLTPEEKIMPDEEDAVVVTDLLGSAR